MQMFPLQEKINLRGCPEKIGTAFFVCDCILRRSRRGEWIGTVKKDKSLPSMPFLGRMGGSI